uniref:Uncharacterized protein n=1 Tax=Magallana gigas TaxID=29159 RepID=A0A8W8N770_MAGGI|nr:uncharacterized protein LOC105339977 [Crassostrea gigas]
MPSKRMNTYFKDKLLVFNSVLAIIFALVGLLGDYWWEMNVTSSSTVDLGLWTQVTCGQTLFGAGNFSTYACFKDDTDNNGWVKFVRITTAFGTSLLGLGLLVHLVYLLKKTPTLKTFSAGVMFIAGVLFFIITCVIIDRIKNLTNGYSAILFFPNRDTILRPHTLPIMFMSFSFLLATIVAVGLLINMDYKPVPPRDPFLERSTSVQQAKATSRV